MTDEKRTGLTPAEADFILEWAGRFPSVIGLWVYGSRVVLDIDRAGDLDVLFILDGEPERSWLQELKAACGQFYATFGVLLDPLVISLPTLWHKLKQGDVQLLTVIAEATVLRDPGLLNSLRRLAEAEVLKPALEQMPAILDFAEKNLGMARDERRPPLRRLVHLRTAARSALQALCLAEGTSPPPPRKFPELAAERWTERLGAAVVASYQDFERVMSAASRQRATSVESVVEWTPPVAQLVAQCVAACRQGQPA